MDESFAWLSQRNIIKINIGAGFAMPLYLFLPFDNKGKVYTWSIIILDKPNVYTDAVVMKKGEFA